MQRKTISIETDEHVGFLRLERPDSMNTFTSELAIELDEALTTLEDDDDVRAIVVSGAGDAFSMGIDVTEHDTHDSEAAYEQWVARMETPFTTIAKMGTPVITAAHGYAVANGLGLVAAADLAVAAEGTQFGATAPKVGLFCMGPAVPLMRSVTEKRCLELLLTGELIDADTALEWGILNRVVPAGEHINAAVELASAITDKSPTAVQLGKQAYYEMANMPYRTALEYSNERFAAVCATSDAAEGIDAFLSGREPEWET
ncbi:enoyl-CoA hydratase/isomerase family protein [Natrarchaeobaculum sulfurireducens]|uniref:Enoyl-CoA hydratase n=1 Tax=Natrarchaeobaculum sulfurireducens TaxID=2044521 RepID=A0A346PU36_9EURY|nr:enoyl-CoA hydratase-related protein [Natrarchaeobaculum sulfurireducens]AXR77002.1 Enoyl-CoA hydratase/carnithine racemase [Natrarchaeobaculum sulfurireducens]AXR83031.1 Enoyl-CoA hydratase [Natrarchaeobaculum sulfurireducens]